MDISVARDTPTLYRLQTPLSRDVPKVSSKIPFITNTDKYIHILLDFCYLQEKKANVLMIQISTPQILV